MHVYSDASCTPAAEGLPKVQCCCWVTDVALGKVWGAVVAVPDWVLRSFHRRATYIAQGELFGPMLALYWFQAEMRGADLMFFVENLGVLSAAVSGRSTVADVNAPLGGLHLWLAELRCSAWWEHVDSKANPADGGSRVGIECPLAKSMGIVLESCAFPEWPDWVEDASPVDWLRIFRSTP